MSGKVASFQSFALCPLVSHITFLHLSFSISNNVDFMEVFW